MPNFLIRLALFIALIFTGVIFVFHSLGSNQIPNPVLRGFDQVCQGKPQPCWNGIVPGVTKFDDVPNLLNTVPDWERATIEKSAMGLSPIWRIANPNFTDCMITVDQKRNAHDFVGYVYFNNCSHIVLADLAHFIEYPGMIYPNCFPPDYLGYRMMSMTTADNLAFRGENVVKGFTLYQPRTKSDWLDLVKNDVEENAGANGWSKEYRYANIGIVSSGCG